MAGTVTATPVLERLGILPVNHGASTGQWIATKGRELASLNPADGSELARVRMATEEDYETVAAHSLEIFERWRMVPAPTRGQIVREIGDELRRAKYHLGALVTLEMGKILAEGQG